MQHKQLNTFQELLDIFATTIMIVATPASIFNLVIASNTLAIIFHSFSLMYFTSYLTVKIFTWKINNGN